MHIAMYHFKFSQTKKVQESITLFQNMIATSNI